MLHHALPKASHFGLCFLIVDQLAVFELSFLDHTRCHARHHFGLIQRGDLHMDLYELAIIAFFLFRPSVSAYLNPRAA